MLCTIYLHYLHYNYLTTPTSVFKHWVAAPSVTLKMDKIKSLETRSLSYNRFTFCRFQLFGYGLSSPSINTKLNRAVLLLNTYR